MDEELKHYLAAMESRMNGRMDAMEIRLREHTDQAVEKCETKLLTAFHQWASPVDMRARSHSAVLRALDVEVEHLADRVTKLDGGRLQI